MMCMFGLWDGRTRPDTHQLFCYFHIHKGFMEGDDGWSCTYFVMAWVGVGRGGDERGSRLDVDRVQNTVRQMMMG